MSVSVKFESPIGNYVMSRQFSPGQQVRIGGKLLSSFSTPAALMSVTLDIRGDNFYPIYDATHSNMLGDYWFDVILPNVEGKAVVTVTAEMPFIGPIGSQIETTIVPISLGNILPDPLPRKEEQEGIFTPVLKWLPWIAIGVGVIYVMTILPRPRRVFSNPKRKRLK